MVEDVFLHPSTDRKTNPSCASSQSLRVLERLSARPETIKFYVPKRAHHPFLLPPHTAPARPGSFPINVWPEMRIPKRYECDWPDTRDQERRGLEASDFNWPPPAQAV